MEHNSTSSPNDKYLILLKGDFLHQICDILYCFFPGHPRYICLRNTSDSPEKSLRCHLDVLEICLSYSCQNAWHMPMPNKDVLEKYWINAEDLLGICLRFSQDVFEIYSRYVLNMLDIYLIYSQNMRYAWDMIQIDQRSAWEYIEIDMSYTSHIWVISPSHSKNMLVPWYPENEIFRF